MTRTEVLLVNFNGGLVKCWGYQQSNSPYSSCDVFWGSMTTPSGNAASPVAKPAPYGEETMRQKLRQGYETVHTRTLSAEDLAKNPIPDFPEMVAAAVFLPPAARRCWAATITNRVAYERFNELVKGILSAIKGWDFALAASRLKYTHDDNRQKYSVFAGRMQDCFSEHSRVLPDLTFAPPGRLPGPPGQARRNRLRQMDDCIVVGVSCEADGDTLDNLRADWLF
ncbi:MAG: hypothetical protein PHZ23_15540 [Acidiphilium sp.]|nr:hypothetical protein [Acidiphilium sp.]